MSKMTLRVVLVSIMTIAGLHGHSLFAVTVAVGPPACQPSLVHFSTIQAAVTAVPSGSTVLVCPGTYPEQITISQTLNLKGITYNNSDQAVITVPSGGLTTTTDVLFGNLFAPQVWITTASVNITNITVDGTGASISTTYLAGIFYESGSSGIVKGVTTRQQTGSVAGVGIWADNGNPTAESVTIENSSVHDVNKFGIFVASNQVPPSLTATILKNDVGAAGQFNIVNLNANASITNNVTTGGGEGIFMARNSVGSITGNTILNASTGILDDALLAAPFEAAEAH